MGACRLDCLSGGECPGVGDVLVGVDDAVFAVGLQMPE